MKHVDYLYFNIYNYFYRTSQYRQNFNPRTQAMYLFALGSGGWMLLMEALFTSDQTYPVRISRAIQLFCRFRLSVDGIAIQLYFYRQGSRSENFREVYRNGGSESQAKAAPHHFCRCFGHALYRPCLLRAVPAQTRTVDQ
jgi:hypothetical protein